MDNKKIGLLIAKQRKNLQLTQEGLAEKLNVTQKSVSRWENGTNLPDISLLPDLCQVLGISINEFFNGELIDKDSKSTVFTQEEKMLVEYMRIQNEKQNLLVRKWIFNVIVWLAATIVISKISPLMVSGLLGILAPILQPQGFSLIMVASGLGVLINVIIPLLIVIVVAKVLDKKLYKA